MSSVKLSFIPRAIASTIDNRLKHYPVVSLTGPRQSGKSTLLQHQYPDYNYVSLEDPAMRLFALEDPQGFLNAYKAPAIIDEAQRVPELFSYLQGIVDEAGQTGMYILSGSHNFLLMQSITQSLAGRVGILRLLPFSLAELQAADNSPPNLDSWLHTGGYPRIYKTRNCPKTYYDDYIETYLQRDVRQVKNISDLSVFLRFMKLCAGRTGQLLNLDSLASDGGIDVKTVRSWLSVLEASYVTYLLAPHHKNFNKRLIKSPKLYFYDTGLAAALLGIANPAQLNTHYLRGGLFENMVISEYLKSAYNKGQKGSATFWRDSNKKEVDLLVGQDSNLHAFEIKSSATYSSNFFDTLNSFGELADIPIEQRALLYGGDKMLPTSHGKAIPWRDIPKAFDL